MNNPNESNTKNSLVLCAECKKPIDIDNIFQCIKINENYYCKDCALKVRTAKTADTTKSNTILIFLKVIIAVISVIGLILGIILGNTYKIVTVSDTLSTSSHFNYILMLSVWISAAVTVLFLFLFYIVIQNQNKILTKINKIK